MECWYIIYIIFHDFTPEKIQIIVLRNIHCVILTLLRQRYRVSKQCEYISKTMRIYYQNMRIYCQNFTFFFFPFYLHNFCIGRIFNIPFANSANIPFLNYSDGNSILWDVVLVSFKNASRDEDNILFEYI